MRRLGAASALALLATGCASVGVTRVNPGAAKPATCALDAFTADAEVERPFVVACLIDSRTGTTLGHERTVAAAVDQARDEACACGADAIIIEGARTEGPNLASHGYGAAVLKAIRYTDQPP